MTDPTATEAELARLDRELSEIACERFSLDDAWRLGLIMRDLAIERTLPVALDVRRGQQQVFHTALDGSTANNDDWILRKVATAWKYGVSSLAIRLRSDSIGDGRGFWWLDPATFAIVGGCVPLRLPDGTPLGTVTVSGLQDVDDHALAVEAIRRFLG
jgi:uncharacterized protein (UPF0303 family)